MKRPFICFLLGIVICLQSPIAKADELNILLQNMANFSKKTHTLQANFVQEKKLSFLQTPLRSEGHFFFTKNFKNSPALLWEYLSPAPSGILFQENEGWIWVENRTKLKKADGYEGNVLKTMIKQMLLWFVFDPENIKNHYAVSLVKDSENTTNSCIALMPNVESFFSSMQICVSKHDYSINSLQFNEKQGDSTNLFFKETISNKDYPTTFPDGTPLP